MFIILDRNDKGQALCSEEIASICAMLGVGNAIFYVPKDKKVHADRCIKISVMRPHL